MIGSSYWSVDSRHKNYTSFLFYLCVIAALSLYIGLLFPYRGEEGVYTASSFEMLFNRDYLTVHFMGWQYGRPPLYNWLILGVAKVIGYPHMLLAARFVTISMTVATGGVLYWFARQLAGDKRFALFSVACFFSGELLFRSSWIAYADPTFAFFIFSALACLWVGHQRQQQRWLLLAIPALLAAFLTKALTCYVFYAITALVLLVQYRNWRYFFNPVSLLLHLAALLFPLLWFYFTAGDKTTGHHMLWDLFHRFGDASFSIWHYLGGLLNKALVYVLRFAPISLIAFYCLFRRKDKQQQKAPKWVKAIGYAILFNVLPYLFAPDTNQIRYLLPLFPLIAIFFAYILSEASERIFKFSVGVLAFCVALKLLVSPWGLPWFEHMTYQYPEVAKKVMRRTETYPLYVVDSDSLIATIDALRYPKTPVIAPNNSLHNIFYVGYPQYHSDSVIDSYKLNRERVNVFCRGKACEGVASDKKH